MRFYVSGNLMRFSNYQREIEVDASTIYDGIRALADRYPEIRSVLLDGQDRVRRVYRIFVDDELVTVDGLKAEVGPDAEITILTAIAGG
jgi:sulfur-carrier protein